MKNKNVRIVATYVYSLFTLRKTRSPLRINKERAFLRVFTEQAIRHDGVVVGRGDHMESIQTDGFVLVSKKDKFLHRFDNL